ncbi:YdcF family protein [Planococcus sp. CP5-4]|uniref:YdcF family protein n=1 Tax=unclassified Planococcus (in: firmicutes) TaxID=2662419 RepID=UPI001C234C8C|nr:YdcF family protein [Planococcus sp. CP5-4]MBU9672927.1 YdcF family protein [Planococcus sp. CP5-4_YE]MBV0908699.1 YdcF family protein [Planococcus sp. CP5-4_UN]MBW6063468.1 YdcF family protein [Planococcus sp. CP5-4]
MFRNKWKRILIVFSLILTILIAATATSIWTFAGESELMEADAAIVLGTKVIGGEPSPVLEQRIRHAIDLYEEGYVEKIIFTGGITDGADLAEAIVSRDFAIRNNIPEEDILIETQSLITEENFLFAGEVAEENDLSSFLVVSDPLHMKRALLMAEHAGIDAHSSPTPSTEFKGFANIAPFFAREVVCYMAYVAMHAVN